MSRMVTTEASPTSDSSVGAERYRRQLEAVCNSATVALFIMDEHRHCRYMNSAAERLTGYSMAEVQGRALHEIFHHTRPDGSQYPPEQCPIVRAFPEGKREQGEEIFVRKDGTFYPVAYTANPIRDEGVILGTIVEVRDISQEKSAQQAFREETRILETLNRVGAALVAELDLERIVQTVTDAATRLCGAEFGAFFYNVLNEHGESYMLYTISGVPREAFSKFPMPRNTAVFDPTFRGTGIIRVDDILADPRYGKSAPHCGMPKGHLPVRSYLAVPVISRSGAVLGGLFFGHHQPGIFTERGERLVTGIAAQASIAIDNAHLYSAAQRELEQRRRAEEHRTLLLHELNHRVKNTLATVQSIARQTLRGSDADSRDSFESRLVALSKTHDLLTQESWEGADLHAVLAQELEPHRSDDRPRVVLDGPAVRLTPKAALALGIGFHELATNAAKHGALSTPNGWVRVEWGLVNRRQGRWIRLRWIESGGPEVTAPSDTGFGSRLIERGLAQELDAEVKIDFARKGVVCTMNIPAPAAAETARDTPGAASAFRA